MVQAHVSISPLNYMWTWLCKTISNECTPYAFTSRALIGWNLRTCQTEINNNSELYLPDFNNTALQNIIIITIRQLWYQSYDNFRISSIFNSILKRNVSHRGISLVTDEFRPQFYYHYRGDISFHRKGFRRTYQLQHVGCGNLFWVLREFFSWDFFVLNQGKQRGCQTCMNCTICQATHKKCLHHLKAYHLRIIGANITYLEPCGDVILRAPSMK